MNTCDRCGQEHHRCKAHNKAGGPCNRPPARGQKVCPLHGGSAPQAKAKAVEVLEEHQARQILSKRLAEAEPIEHPIYELLTLAAEMREWQHVLRERLDNLEALNLEDKQGVDRERALVTLYRSALNDLGKLLVDMAKLDLKERALALHQAQAKQLLDDVTQALKQTGLGDHELAVRQTLGQIIRTRIQPDHGQTVEAIAR